MPHVINTFRRRRKKRGETEGLTFKVGSEERNQGPNFFWHQVLSCSLQSVHGDCAAQQEKTWPDQTGCHVAEKETHSLDPRACRVQLVHGKMRQDRYRTRVEEDMLMLPGCCCSPPPVFNPILSLSPTHTTCWNTEVITERKHGKYCQRSSDRVWPFTSTALWVTLFSFFFPFPGQARAFPCFFFFFIYALSAVSQANNEQNNESSIWMSEPWNHSMPPLDSWKLLICATCIFLLVCVAMSLVDLKVCYVV